MFAGSSESKEGVPTSNGLKLALTAAVVGILFVGLAPSVLMNAAKDAASVFVQ